MAAEAGQDTAAVVPVPDGVAGQVQVLSLFLVPPPVHELQLPQSDQGVGAASESTAS